MSFAWSALWGNFAGALLVGLGGIFGTLAAYDINKKETHPASWALVLGGGCAIAGAALRAALEG